MRGLLSYICFLVAVVVFFSIFIIPAFKEEDVGVEKNRMTFFPTKKFIFNCFLTLRRKRWSEEDDKGGEKRTEHRSMWVF